MAARKRTTALQVNRFLKTGQFLLYTQELFFQIFHLFGLLIQTVAEIEIGAAQFTQLQLLVVLSGRRNGRTGLRRTLQ